MPTMPIPVSLWESRPERPTVTEAALHVMTRRESVNHRLKEINRTRRAFAGRLAHVGCVTLTGSLRFGLSLTSARLLLILSGLRDSTAVPVTMTWISPRPILIFYQRAAAFYEDQDLQ